MTSAQCRAVAVSAKICGLTRPEDAAFAAAHGAWRLGIVFASGPRVVATERAREIVAAAAGVPVLGVFGPEPVGTMLERVSAVGLAGVQLHGVHAPHVARDLRAHGLEVWNVVPVRDGVELAPPLRAAAIDADALLIEARVPGGSGGKGIAIALDLARAARLAAPPIRFVLAGGLTAVTVSEAIRVVGPDAVDVSSGIEMSPGVKDHDRLARFLENVLAARPAA
jgi:phosphoribosylanthranilate isomerase